MLCAAWVHNYARHEATTEALHSHWSIASRWRHGDARSQIFRDPAYHHQVSNHPGLQADKSNLFFESLGVGQPTRSLLLKKNTIFIFILIIYW